MTRIANLRCKRKISVNTLQNSWYVVVMHNPFFAWIKWSEFCNCLCSFVAYTWVWHSFGRSKTIQHWMFLHKILVFFLQKLVCSVMHLYAVYNHLKIVNIVIDCERFIGLKIHLFERPTLLRMLYEKACSVSSDLNLMSWRSIWSPSMPEYLTLSIASITTPVFSCYHLFSMCVRT